MSAAPAESTGERSGGTLVFGILAALLVFSALSEGGPFTLSSIGRGAAGAWASVAGGGVWSPSYRAGPGRVDRRAVARGVLGPGFARYERLTAEAARSFGLDPRLLRAMMYVESAYRPGAVSGKGAAGLMQLMPGTAREMGVKRTFSAAENVRGGARYLREMLDRFGGDLTLALAAYNAGPENVRRYGGVPPYPETVAYVTKVRVAYDALRAASDGS